MLWTHPLTVVALVVATSLSTGEQRVKQTVLLKTEVKVSQTERIAAERLAALIEHSLNLREIDESSQKIGVEPTDECGNGIDAVLYVNAAAETRNLSVSEVYPAVQTSIYYCQSRKSASANAFRIIPGRSVSSLDTRVRQVFLEFEPTILNQLLEKLSS